MNHYDGDSHINVGSGSDIEIGSLAKLICEVVGFTGELLYDTSRPDGTPRKLMSSAKLQAMGWKPRIGLEDGLRITYQWFLDHQDNFRGERA